MRQTKLWMIAAMLTWCGHATVLAQDDEQDVDTYFTEDDMPDMMKFLPGPPDSTSVAFMNDVAGYYWGKEMRKNAERAEEAKRDADAARLAASVAYVRLHTSERFLEQMKKARDEYKALKSDPTAVRTAKTVSIAASDDTAYTLQGSVATGSTRGVVIQNQQKVVRR